MYGLWMLLFPGVMASSTDSIDQPASPRLAAVDVPAPPLSDEGASGGSVRGPRSQEVTRRLLDSAVEVFGERGYEAARVHEVARRCGMTTGAVYSRWPTKLDLFLAVIEYVIPQRMIFMVVGTDMPAVDKFATLGANLLSASGHKFRDLMLEAFVTARRDESLAEMVSRSLDTEASTLTAMVTEGKELGLIDPALSTEAIVLFCQALGLGTHLAVSMESDTRPAPSTDEWNAVIGRIIESVAAPRSEDL